MMNAELLYSRSAHRIKSENLTFDIKAFLQKEA